MNRKMLFGCVMTAILPLVSSCLKSVPNPTDSPALPAGVTAARCTPGASASAAPPATLAQWAQGAQIFEGLGGFHRPVSTRSPEAQAYFDQGMRFLWAFNHDESTRSFARAAESDPDCAMCFWGVALTVGPNYNFPMMAEPRAKVAWEALQHAEKSAKNGSPVEQALIAALAKRYPNANPLDATGLAPVLTAYAEAMKTVANDFPADNDVQTLYAESLMTINAWKLWTANGKPVPGTEEIVATLEGVLSRSPTHPGANHYYIHTMEASPDPAKAVASAERLRGMMPAAGHLEHMPAHILQRVGRYEEASAANRSGASADAAYYQKTTPLDYYAMYTAHNYQFLAFSAAMEGRKTETLDAARRSRTVTPDDLLLGMPGADWYVAELYLSMVRFGMWDEILAEAPPNPKLLGLTAGYRYARSMALSAKGRPAEAKTEIAELEKLAASAPADYGAGQNTLKDVVSVAIPLAKAKIAAASGQRKNAIGLLREAVTKEDQLAYDEPEDWFFPVRHVLGAELLGDRRPHAAELVYRESLQRHPHDGWALFGLTQALESQGKKLESANVKKEFTKAWARADIKLIASAF